MTLEIQAWPRRLWRAFAAASSKSSNHTSKDTNTPIHHDADRICPAAGGPVHRGCKGVPSTDLTYDDIVGAIKTKSVKRPQRFSLRAVEIERPTALKASTNASLGNSYGSGNKSEAHKAAISAAKKGIKIKRQSEAHKAAISAAKTTCICGKCGKCKARARQQKCRAKKAKRA